MLTVVTLRRCRRGLDRGEGGGMWPRFVLHFPVMFVEKSYTGCSFFSPGHVLFTAARREKEVHFKHLSLGRSNKVIRSVINLLISFVATEITTISLLLLCISPSPNVC